MSGARITGKELRLVPGSKEAVEAGCICSKSDSEDRYYINEHCELHYYILVISNFEKTRKYMLKRDNEITAILYSLLAAVIITFGYFLFL